jgi:hypothetical protein
LLLRKDGAIDVVRDRETYASLYGNTHVPIDLRAITATLPPYTPAPIPLSSTTAYGAPLWAPLPPADDATTAAAASATAAATATPLPTTTTTSVATSSAPKVDRGPMMRRRHQVGIALAVATFATVALVTVRRGRSRK